MDPYYQVHQRDLELSKKENFHDQTKKCYLRVVRKAKTRDTCHPNKICVNIASSFSRM